MFWPRTTIQALGETRRLTDCRNAKKVLVEGGKVQNHAALSDVSRAPLVFCPPPPTGPYSSVPNYLFVLEKT
jgi:hypothetical protein